MNEANPIYWLAAALVLAAPIIQLAIALWGAL